jgi:hypothetical protein
VGTEELDAECGGLLGGEAEPGHEELVDVALERRPNAGAARVQRVVEVFNTEQEKRNSPSDLGFDHRLKPITVVVLPRRKRRVP